MKMYYPIIATIALGISLLLVFGFNGQNNTNQHANSDSELMAPNAVNNRLVPLDRAKRNIYLQQLWWTTLPQNVTWIPDSNTLIFPKVQLQRSDSQYAFIMDFLEEYAKQYGEWGPDSATCNLTLIPQSAISTSFLIPLEDIEEALVISDMKYDTNRHGIRVYMGLKWDGATTCENLISAIDTMETHTYVVPTDIGGRDIFHLVNGDSFVFDLTAPCPKTCDESSPMNHPNVPSLWTICSDQ